MKSLEGLEKWPPWKNPRPLPGELPETGEAVADMAGAAFRSQGAGTAAANATMSSSGQEAIG